MTKRKIILSQKKIEKSKNQGYHTEALIKYYHLNVEVLKFISSKLNPGFSSKNLKAKTVLIALISEIKKQPGSKLIAKKSLKALKPWLNKMDIYFKTLKVKNPLNTMNMIVESEKIFSLLYISFTKTLALK
jgi:hypothetical protein